MDKVCGCSSLRLAKGTTRCMMDRLRRHRPYHRTGRCHRQHAMDVGVFLTHCVQCRGGQSCSTLPLVTPRWRGTPWTPSPLRSLWSLAARTAWLHRSPVVSVRNFQALFLKAFFPPCHRAPPPVQQVSGGPALQAAEGGTRRITRQSTRGT